MPAGKPIKVIIKEREVEYISDYDEGWKFSAGDPFKFPVIVGGYPCFVKRFTQKSPEDISGWDLLTKMIGKYERTLSRVYDIKNVEEGEKEIYYVFYEYLDGITLDKNIPGRDIDLSHLNTDLFDAIRTLQKYGFWFADFTEKNIYCQKGGTFMLVDVDSTQRITNLPDNEMFGSKDYWILVFKFYKEILNKTNIRLSDINGITLNYLQVPFLVLRLKLFMAGIDKDYNSTALFNQLPSQLVEMAPEFREIFLNVIRKGKEPLSPEEISQIETLIEKRIIKSEHITEMVVSPVSLPLIKAFTTSSNEVESGGTFTLNWQVENSDKLELYKNGAKFQTLNISQTELALKEFADGTRQESSYLLIAYKGLAMAKSNPVTIKLKEASRKKIRPLKIVGIIAGLAAMAAAFFFLYKHYHRNNYNASIRQFHLHEGIDSTITIYGNGFPSKDKIHIRINEAESSIILASPDSLVVSLPPPKFTDSTGAAFVTVDINGKKYNAGSFVYSSPVEISQPDLYEDSVLTFLGGNLSSSNTKVYFDNKEIPIYSQSKNDLAVIIPKLEDTTPGRSVSVKVNQDNHIIFSADYTVIYDTVNLTDLAPEFMWISAEILPDGKISNGGNLRWPGGLNDETGYARTDITAMEDAASYKVLRTHPEWISNGSIRGFSPLQNVRGRKVFKAHVGFIDGGRSVDGVVFQVWVHYQSNSQEKSTVIIQQPKVYDGRLIFITADLPDDVGDEFTVELRVDAGMNQNFDWAGWIDPVIISRRLTVMATGDD